MWNAHKILPNYSYDDYCQWEGRWELIDGIPYAMSPMPSPRHQMLSGKIHRLLLNAIDESGCDCQVYQPIDLKIKENTVVQPDLSIVCQPIKLNYLDFAPVVVFEILSPSTALKDKHTKLSLYEEFGIKYYYIVDPDKNEVQLYELSNGQYVERQEKTKLVIDHQCTISLDLNSIW